jgi:hypothetical protein
MPGTRPGMTSQAKAPGFIGCILSQTLRKENKVMGPFAFILSAILALLIALSMVPAFLIFCLCEFSSACLLHNFAWAIAVRGLPRTMVIAMVLGPLLLSCILAFLGYRRRRDVLKHRDRSFG